MFKYSFEKLEVWHNSVDLTKSIYLLTKQFPDEEKFGLVNQLRRASVSVSSNIAEGTSRSTNKDQAHFSSMAYSSLMEMLNQLIISKELNFITDTDYSKTRSKINEVSNKLNALRKSQLNR